MSDRAEVITDDDREIAETTFEAIPMNAEPPAWMTDAGWDERQKGLLAWFRVMRRALQMDDKRLYRAFCDDPELFTKFAEGVEESIQWLEESAYFLRAARARVFVAGERARQGWPVN